MINGHRIESEIHAVDQFTNVSTNDWLTLTILYLVDVTKYFLWNS